MLEILLNKQYQYVYLYVSVQFDVLLAIFETKNKKVENFEEKPQPKLQPKTQIASVRIGTFTSKLV